jgi:hypothetical protein
MIVIYFTVVITSRIRWAGHVVRTWRVCTEFWWGNLRERDNWKDPGVDGRIICRRIFKKWDVWYGLDFAGPESGGGNL